MLRITIEFIPFGQEDQALKLGEMVIANAGKNEDGTRRYEGWTAKDTWSGEKARFGRLLSYDRKSSPWELIRLMLEAIRLENHKPEKGKRSLSQRLKTKLLG
jgi:hypothetical protein